MFDCEAATCSEMYFRSNSILYLVYSINAPPTAVPNTAPMAAPEESITKATRRA